MGGIPYTLTLQEEMKVGEFINTRNTLKKAAGLLFIEAMQPSYWWPFEKTRKKDRMYMASETLQSNLPTPHPPALPVFLSLCLFYARISSFPLAILPLKNGLSGHLFMCGKCIKIYKINPFISRRKLAFCLE